MFPRLVPQPVQGSAPRREKRHEMPSTNRPLPETCFRASQSGRGKHRAFRSSAVARFPPKQRRATWLTAASQQLPREFAARSGFRVREVETGGRPAGTATAISPAKRQQVLGGDQCAEGRDVASSSQPEVHAQKEDLTLFQQTIASDRLAGSPRTLAICVPAMTQSTTRP